MAEPVTGEEWEQLDAAAQAVTPILACKNCGCTKPAPTGTPTDLFPSEHCGDCPPWQCGDCGGMCSAGSLCSCWTRLDGMPLADIKALFARDDVLAIGGLGHHEGTDGSWIGRTYLERGSPVVVLVRWTGKGPRNVLIRREDGHLVVRPFRGLRKVPEDDHALPAPVG